MKARCQIIVAILFVMIFQAGPVLAQGGSATLSGRVTDPGGLPVVGVKAQAINAATGVAYPAETNDAGRYDFPSLPPGKYRIELDKEGFQRVVKPDVELHVADNISIDFNLQVGQLTQAVTVEGGAPIVNTTSSELGGLVESHDVADLPLNGRNYINLTLMQTGITTNPNQSTTGSFVGIWFSSNGAPIRSNNFMIDGAIMQDLNNGSTADFSGRTLGIDGIQEYRVITNSFSAEYGLLMGSQTVMVSKGGTNQFHGSAFEYLRNSVLDAANFYDQPLLANGFRRLPEYQRNNFGGSFGGPIRKDKTFFFATFERLRENLGVTNIENVPGAGCHGPAGAVVWNGVLPPSGVAPPHDSTCPQMLGTTSSTVTIASVMAPLVALYPLPNLPNNQLSQPYTQPDADNFGQIRIDQIFSASDSMFARYTIGDDTEAAALPFPNYFIWDRLTRHQYATVGETHIFSTSLLNDVRFSFSRTSSTRTSPSNLIGPQYSFVAGTYEGTIAVGGGQFTLFGPSNAAPNIQTQSILTLGDDLSYTHGLHSFKFGTLVNSYRQYGQNYSNFHGKLTFGNVAGFLTGNATQYVAVTPGSIPDRTFQFYTLGFYAQDDWRLRPNFTLNLGLRYEPQTQYKEVHGISSALINPLTDTSFTPGPLFKNPTWHNFSPRVGFAWDVRGNGKTAIRAGAALLYDISNYGNAATSFNGAQPPFSSSSTAAGTFTLPFTFLPSAVGNTGDSFQYDLQQARLYTWNLTVDQRLPFSTALSVSYVGSRGVHLLGQSDANPNVPASFGSDGLPFWPAAPTSGCPIGVLTPGCRSNPRWGSIQYQHSNADSIYHALEVSVVKRLTKGLQFQSSFTWQKLIDTNQGEGIGDCTASSSVLTDPFSAQYDRGRACFDVARTWVFNAIYNLPSPKINERFLAGLTSGWGMTGIFTVHSGFPFNPGETTERSRSGVAGGSTGFGLIDRPDWMPGRNPYNATHGTSSGCGIGSTAIAAGTPLGTPTLYYDPCAFTLQQTGHLGNVARNSFSGPGFANLDFAVKKDTKLGFFGEAGNLEFRTEFFNIFNHPNFAIPLTGVLAGTLADTTEFPISSAGQINSTVSTSRQIQFSLRVAW